MAAYSLSIDYEPPKVKKRIVNSKISFYAVLITANFFQIKLGSQLFLFEHQLEKLTAFSDLYICIFFPLVLVLKHTHHCLSFTTKVI